MRSQIEVTLKTSKRILAIDYGERRLGIAISDPTNTIARGLPTLEHSNKLFDRLRGLIQEHDVGSIVVGIPYTLKGDVGMKAKEVQEFIDRLQNEVHVPVRTWDERFTSRLARNAMREMGTKKSERQRKGSVDLLAATLLLQSYLDSLKT